MTSLPSQAHTLVLLLNNSRLERERVAAFQSSQLRRLVRHAFRSVPYYRDLFSQHGLIPTDIRSAEDISSVPFTSKDDMRNLPPQDILAHGSSPSRMVQRKTSGSSGKPFTIYLTTFEDHLLNLFRIQVRKKSGLRISDRAVIISETPLVKDTLSFLSLLKNTLKLYRTSCIDCYQDDSEIVRELEIIHPDLIIGYPTTLARLACLLSREKNSTLMSAKSGQHRMGIHKDTRPLY